MNSLIRRADRLAEALRARRLRQEGRCPRCGLPLTEPLVVVLTDDDPQICSCRPVTVIHLCGPPTQFRALDIETGEVISIEEMQAKYMKGEVQNVE